VKSHTPLQIRNANIARKRLANLTAEHRKRTLKYPPIKDDRLVKPPVGSYIYFATDWLQSGDFKHLSFKERSDRVNIEWENLPEQEKQVSIHMIRQFLSGDLGTNICNSDTRKKQLKTRNDMPRNTVKYTANSPPLCQRLNQRLPAQLRFC
jgi:hypothetical protein